MYGNSLSQLFKVRTVGLATALILSTAGALAATFKSDSILVEDPWSRATPGGAKVGAGFLTIKNEGKTEDRLISATSPIAARAEIHETKMENDMMTMRPVSGGIAIPPGGSVALAPQGYHLMFADLAAPLKEGERFKATLTFEHAGAVEVTFDIKPLGAPAPAAHHHH
jgi:copper(I)-binding protein